MANESDAYGTMIISTPLIKVCKPALITVLTHIDDNSAYPFGLKTNTEKEITQQLDQALKTNQEARFHFRGIGRWQFINNITWLAQPKIFDQPEAAKAAMKLAQMLLVYQDDPQYYLAFDYQETEPNMQINHKINALLKVVGINYNNQETNATVEITKEIELNA